MVYAVQGAGRKMRHGVQTEGPSPNPPEGAPRGEEERALAVYEERIAAFERSLNEIGRPRRRRKFSDYTTKNCEEAWSVRGRSGAKEGDGVG